MTLNSWEKHLCESVFRFFSQLLLFSRVIVSHRGEVRDVDMKQLRSWLKRWGESAIHHTGFCADMRLNDEFTLCVCVCVCVCVRERGGESKHKPCMRACVCWWVCEVSRFMCKRIESTPKQKEREGESKRNDFFFKLCHTCAKGRNLSREVTYHTMLKNVLLQLLPVEYLSACSMSPWFCLHVSV